MNAALVSMRRKHTQWNINQNASEIIIRRKGQKREGGKIVNVNAMLPLQRMRLYVSGGSENVIVETIGERQIDRYYRLLAEWDADIQAGTEVKDSFVCNGERYEVKAVNPQSVNGQIVGKQCLIERVL